MVSDSDFCDTARIASFLRSTSDQAIVTALYKVQVQTWLPSTLPAVIKYGIRTSLGSQCLCIQCPRIMML